MAWGNDPPVSGPENERCQLGDLVGEVVRQEAADVGERRPSHLHGGHDGAEVVAVAGHRDDVTGSLQGMGDPELVLGGDRAACVSRFGPTSASRRDASATLKPFRMAESVTVGIPPTLGTFAGAPARTAVPHR